MGTLTKTSLGIGITLLIGLGACKKNNSGAIDGNLVKYFDYKVGTYWIMRDSISGRVDSFFVTNNQLYSTFNSIQENDIGIQISEYTSGHINPDIMLWGINLVSDDFYFDFSSSDSLFTYMDDGPLFTYPFISNQYENILSYYTISGIPYSNVAEIIQNTIGPNTNDLAYDDWFYINSTDGLIKIRLYHPGAKISYVWELQRENIVH